MDFRLNLVALVEEQGIEGWLDAYVVMAYVVMASTVMAYKVLAFIVMASTVMAQPRACWMPT